MKRKSRIAALLLTATLLLNLANPLAAQAEPAAAGDIAESTATAETAAEPAAAALPTPAPDTEPTTPETAEALPDTAGGGGQPLSPFAPINPDYVEYLESGEVSAASTGYVPSVLDLRYLAQSYAEQPQLYAAETLPPTYDLRDTGTIGSVKNQGNFGTCWAFAALGAVESNLMKRQFSSYNLSVVHLAWFSSMGALESLMQVPAVTDAFNTAGNTAKAVGALAAWKGPVADSTLPYASLTKDTKPDESYRYASSFHLQDAYYMSPELTPTTLSPMLDQTKQMLMEHGALTLSYYSGDNDTSSIYHSKYSPANHAVLLVGWDDDYAKENFSASERPPCDGAWLLRNSWGADASSTNDGYFWISYEDMTIDIGCSYLMESADNYKTNYQYDLCGWTGSIAADTFYDTEHASKTGYMSNIFTANGDEQLEAVSFYTTDANTAYEISIYTDVSAGQPTSGTLAATGQTGSEAYAGYHTIELTAPVALSKNQDYAVVVKLTNPTFAYPLPVMMTSYAMNSQPAAALHKSFSSADGTNWKDISDLPTETLIDSMYYMSGYCFCLKAFTNPLPESGAAITNVRFSLLDGDIALGSKLTLDGPANIYYQINDGEALPYTEPFTIDRACTVTAWGVDGALVGNRISRHFTQGTAELTDAILQQDGHHYPLHFDSSNTATLTLSSGSDISVLFQGNGSLTIQDANITLSPNQWSYGFLPFPDWNNRTLLFTVSSTGKLPTTYTVKIYNNSDSSTANVTYDYTNETVTYEDILYDLLDETGKVIAKDGSITNFIGCYNETTQQVDTHTLTLCAKDDHTQILDTFQVPVRPYISTLKRGVDTVNTVVTSSFDVPSAAWVYSSSPDMIDSLPCKDSFFYLSASQEVYLQLPAGSHNFSSSIYHITTPAALAPPTLAAVDIGPDYIKLQNVAGAKYLCYPQGEKVTNENWQESSDFFNLNPNTTYQIEAYFPATAERFCSDTATLAVTTVAGVALPLEIQVEGTRYPVHITVWLPEGTTTLSIAKYLEPYYLHQVAGAASSVTVTVVKKDGKLTADRDSIPLDCLLPKSLASYVYTVNWFDVDNNYAFLGRKGCSFPHVGSLTWQEIALPEGYSLANDALLNPTATPIALERYQNGEDYYASESSVSLPVRKTLSPTPTPTTAPTPTPTPGKTVYRPQTSQGTGEPSAALKQAGFPTSESLVDALRQALEKSLGSGAKLFACNVVLQKSTDQGQSWQPLSGEETLPGMVPVTLPWPDGLTYKNYKNYKITVAHMFESSGKAGTIELLNFTADEQGLTILVTSLSPFAIGWTSTGATPTPTPTLTPAPTLAPTAAPTASVTPVPTTAPAAPTADTHPEIGAAKANGTWGSGKATATPAPTAAATPGKRSVVPATGDEGRPGLAALLLLISGAGLGFGVALWYRRKKQ